MSVVDYPRHPETNQIMAGIHPQLQVLYMKIHHLNLPQMCCINKGHLCLPKVKVSFFIVFSFIIQLLFLGQRLLSSPEGGPDFSVVFGGNGAL